MSIVAVVAAYVRREYELSAARRDAQRAAAEARAVKRAEALARRRARIAEAESSLGLVDRYVFGVTGADVLRNRERQSRANFGDFVAANEDYWMDRFGELINEYPGTEYHHRLVERRIRREQRRAYRSSDWLLDWERDDDDMEAYD